MREPTPTHDIATLQSHILKRELDNPASGATLSWITSALSISAKIITDKIRRARLVDVLGDVGRAFVGRGWKPLLPRAGR